MSASVRFEQIKALGHPLRQAVLRRLMARPATLSQLGAHFHRSPAHIRHHLQALQAADLVELTADPPRQNHLEKYYQAVAGTWLFQLAILPESPAGRPALVLGSMDLATREWAGRLQERRPGLGLRVLPLNSLDGLVMLRQGVCQMVTCHLKEPASESYNRSYVQHLFPGQAMALLRLFVREAGLVIQSGNPKQIRELADLARPGLRLINREPGAGLRVWLDQSLARLGLEPAALAGYDTAAPSHEQVVQAIQAGRADVGLGLAAGARAAGLGFIPLFEEPYDLVLPAGRLAERRYQPLFEHLNSSDFRDAIRARAGYRVSSQSGQADTLAGFSVERPAPVD